MWDLHNDNLGDSNGDNLNQYKGRKNHLPYSPHEDLPVLGKKRWRYRVSRGLCVICKRYRDLTSVYTTYNYILTSHVYTSVKDTSERYTYIGKRIPIQISDKTYIHEKCCSLLTSRLWFMLEYRSHLRFLTRYLVVKTESCWWLYYFFNLLRTP